MRLLRVPRCLLVLLLLFCWPSLVAAKETFLANNSGNLPTTALNFSYPEHRRICGSKFNESSERRLKRLLFKSYDPFSRPVVSDDTSVQVSLAISLFHLLDTNEKQQTIKAVYNLRFSWTDEYLKWNSSDYCGLKTIFVPSALVWKPDLIILNTAQDEFKDYMQTNAIIGNAGNILWMTPFSAATTCNIDVRYYPFDVQYCKLVFMSWTYAGKQVNLTFDPAVKNGIYYNPDNQEWEVTNIEAERNDVIYVCCPNDPYPDVTFKMRMQRRSLFYVLNLVLPSILIYCLAVVGFFLPNTDKVTMETTVLLTLVVFLLIVSDTMPPTPDSVPVLSLLFVLILTLVSVAIFMAVVVTNLSTRPRFKMIPCWGRRLIRLIFHNNLDNPNIKAVLNRTNPEAQHKAESKDGENNNNNCHNPIISQNQESTHGKTLTDWELLAEALDWFCFYIFIGLSLAMVLLFIILMLPAFTNLSRA